MKTKMQNDKDSLIHLAPAFEVEVLEDLPFGQSRTVQGDVKTWRLDIYRPIDDTPRSRPAIMWFHGGGFKPDCDKRITIIPWFAKAFASRGYIGIAPDYRTRSDPETDKEGTVRDAVADGRMALEWARANSEVYHIDNRRLVLAGGSAGGMLVLNLCHDPRQPLSAERDGVRAILNMWGSPGERSRLFAKVNPASPPTLLVHGTADTNVPYVWSQALSEELTQAGVSSVLLSLQDAPHRPLTHMDEIIERTALFLYEHLEQASSLWRKGSVESEETL